MRSERGSSTILHCLQWYKLVLHTRLSTAAVQYLVHTCCLALLPLLLLELVFENLYSPQMVELKNNK